jgi:hypothetical protein
MVIRPYLVATCAVLPLLMPEVWSGFRLGLADPVLSAITALEQPLSIRSPGGIWAMGLALAWFGLVYWHGNLALWEAALVLLGGAAALVRLGNVWVDAAALVLPLARQVALLKLRSPVVLVLVAVSLAVTACGLNQTRPPDLPGGAVLAVRQATGPGTVLADWRWAGEVQRQLGTERHVFGSAGLTSESSDFWLNYLRIVQAHEHWADLLRQLEVDAVVLDSGEWRQTAALVRASPDWRVTYDGDDALVAQRASSP